MKESQLDYIKKYLQKYGSISRNHCLKKYISRLSARILDLRNDGLEIEGKSLKTKKGRDYIYTLIK